MHPTHVFSRSGLAEWMKEQAENEIAVMMLVCLCHLTHRSFNDKQGGRNLVGITPPRCAQILSDSFASMTIEACQNQPTVSFHYLGGFGMQRPKDIRLS